MTKVNVRRQVCKLQYLCMHRHNYIPILYTLIDIYMCYYSSQIVIANLFMYLREPNWRRQSSSPTGFAKFCQQTNAWNLPIGPHTNDHDHLNEYLDTHIQLRFYMIHTNRYLYVLSCQFAVIKVVIWSVHLWLERLIGKFEFKTF